MASLHLCFIAINANILADNIVFSFPFFPRLHRFLSSRTNTNPPVIITDVEPQGRAVIHYQAPAGMAPNPIEDDLIDPVLHDITTIPFTDFKANLTQTTPILSSLSSHFTPHLAEAAKKENITPVAMVKKTKALAVSVSQLVENAKATIKKNPAKCTFKEMLCDLQQ